MNVLFSWTGVTPAMVACWRELAGRNGVRLKLLIELDRRPDETHDPRRLVEGLDCTFRQADDRLDRRAIDRELESFAADVVVVLGWRSRLCRAVAESRACRGVPKVFAFDMTFAWKIRKLLAPLAVRGYLRHFAAALVTGERSAMYARYLGFPDSRVETGLIGLDVAAYRAARLARPAADRHPRQFLYVGRYAPEKRLDLLVAAYAAYRRRVREPWGLTCVGRGPEQGRLAGLPGVTDLGFVQPAAMPELFARHGCFVIASDYDPWPLVVAESLASGMPVVCTDACGSHVEFIRSGYNGRVVGTGDPDGLAAGLEWIHDRAASLPQMSPRCVAAAEPYDAPAWADRFLDLCGRLTGRSDFR